MYRTVLLAPALVAACADAPFGVDTGSLSDTGGTACGRVRDTEGILVYQDNGNSVRAPLEAPSTTQVTTGVAGPLTDGTSYVAVTDGQTMHSSDGGCNWTRMGSIPAGNWELVAAGARVYGFDTHSTAAAWSDDFGQSWTPFDVGEPFIGGIPVVDISDPARIRGLQARGVVTSTDAGQTWSVGAPLPAGATNPSDADVSPFDLNVAVLGAATGAWFTTNAGSSWTTVATDRVSAVAVHPHDKTSLFAAMMNPEGVSMVSRSADSGATWTRLVDSSQVALPSSARLWPVPGNPAQVLTAFGPTYNADTEAMGVNLYVVTAGTGTHTAFVGSFFHVNQVSFGPDRWVAAVDAVR